MPRKPVVSKDEWDYLNIKIPTVLKKKLAIQALEESRDMTDIVIEALKKHLD